MTKAISLKHVIKLYENGVRAINDVSMEICMGENVRLYGTAGSGKSTLARLIAGVEHPSDGKIYVLDKLVSSMDADTAGVFRNRSIGLLSRKPLLMPRLTIWENAALPLNIRGVPAKDRQKAAMDSLKSLNLTHAAYACPAQLTRLENQKAVIARILTAKPDIILLDDAAAELSEKDVDQIKDIFSTLKCCGHYTIIELASTDHGLIKADRCMTLEYGKIKEERK
jgi:ABC-type ATPase involved in cell division